MDGMKDFPADFNKNFVISFNYFKHCNIGYFNDNISYGQKYWRFGVKFVVVISNFISMLMYMFQVLETIKTNPQISEIAFMVSICLIRLQSITKAVFLFPKKKDIETLIKGLAKMWKTENLTDFQIKEKTRRVKQVNFGHIVFYWVTNISMFQNLVPQLVFTVFGKVRHQDFHFILPFGEVYPFDPVKNWGRYLVVYVWQSYSIIHLIYYYLGVHCLLVTLCSHLSTEFALLREDIKNAVPVQNKNNMAGEMTVVDTNMKIESMVKNHQELIKLAQLLNHIFNRLICIDLCFFAVVLCFFSIVLTVSHNALEKFTNIMTVSAVLIMIYLFCYYSEMLKEESEGIADSAYENPWYEGGTHYQKTIRFIIMRAQLPCYLTSLNYAPISLNTFTRVMSTTWSYFSLVMTMYGNK